MDTITCPRCGIEQSKRKDYCIFCGFEFVPRKPAEQKTEILVCQKCGGQIDPTTKTCPECEWRRKQKEKERKIAEENERKIAEENERKKERRHRIILTLIFLFLLASIFGLL